MDFMTVHTWFQLSLHLFMRLLTFACAFVRLQLHEVRARAGEGLVEVDETEMGARAAAINLGARVRS